MNIEAPFFSIIVPCCDVEQYVRESLDSVLNQSFTDWECIIGVETSKDKTEDIVRAYAAKDSRFKVFTGPRSGSCSVPRNRGIDMATGEYIIFLDGDDTIVEGSLQRLHDKIAARPGADLYPCAIQVHNDMTGKDEALRDNYPQNFNDELTGPEATLLLERRCLNPCPMLQQTVFRRMFLATWNLKCIPGLRNQDSEFSPRALYRAKSVVPLHEAFYIYRIRQNSVQTNAKGKGYFYKDWTVIIRSLLAFHAEVTKEPGFDTRVSVAWARAWISILQIKWFSRDFVKEIPRQERLDSLRQIFSAGFEDSNALLRYASFARRVAGWWIRAFVRFPVLRPAAEFFFTRLYFPLLNRRR
jgi:glycosyltransferase involved in cell wall biosynthesis